MNMADVFWIVLERNSNQKKMHSYLWIDLFYVNQVASDHLLCYGEFKRKEKTYENQLL